jgi:hypothetical protein
MDGLRKNINNALEQSITYEEYLTLMQQYALDGKTSGTDQRQNLIDFTKLNAFRMQRLDKTTAIQTEILKDVMSVKNAQTWLVLTETWCGDAAQNLPILNKLSLANDRIDLRLVFRDEHPEIMSQFLTNGGKSIPKLISLDKEHNVLFTWGPRPVPAQEMVMDFKNGIQGSKTYSDISMEIQKWYVSDKSKTLQAEMWQHLKASCSKVATVK